MYSLQRALTGHPECGMEVRGIYESHQNALMAMVNLTRIFAEHIVHFQRRDDAMWIHTNKRSWRDRTEVPACLYIIFPYGKASEIPSYSYDILAQLARDLGEDFESSIGD